MKFNRWMCVLNILAYLIFLPFGVSAQISTLPKPLTGTFAFPDFAITTESDFNAYLDEIKSLGMDTIIWGYSGTVIYKTDCSGVEVTENYFTGNDTNYLMNADKLLTGIRNKGLSVFIGLSGTYRCDDLFWGSNPGDTNSYAGRTITQSRTLISSLTQLCQNKGWNCDDGSFIKGFYIPPERPVSSLTANGAFYRLLSQEIKAMKPNMKILVSPYLLNSENYGTIYNNIYYAVGNLGFDIIAPQDGVGAGNTTTYAIDRQHYLALYDAVNAANTAYGKQVAKWANIETFSPSANRQPPWPPSDYKSVSWQLRASDDVTDKKITWIHTWGFSTLPILNNNGTQYTPDMAVRRAAFKNDYLRKPIIVGAFTWYTPVNFVVKGYNFGPNGQTVRLVLHYQGNSFSQNLTITVLNQTIGEIRLPLSSIPGFNPNNQFELAIQNTAGDVGYYVSQNPETAAVPSFPEIVPFTPTPSLRPSNTPTHTPSPTTVLKPGDANGDNRVDGLDYVIWVTHYGATNPSGPSYGDFNRDGKVDGIDYVTWLANYGK